MDCSDKSPHINQIWEFSMAELKDQPDTKYIRRHIKKNLELTIDAGGDLVAFCSSSSFFSKSFSFSSNFSFLSIAS